MKTTTLDLVAWWIGLAGRLLLAVCNPALAAILTAAEDDE